MAAQPATPPAEQAIRSSRDLQSLQEALLAPVTTIKQFLHVVPASVLPELQQQLRDAVSDAGVLSELVREQQWLTGLDPFSDAATRACSPVLLHGEADGSTGNAVVETYTEISDPDAHRSLDDNTRKQLMAVVGVCDTLDAAQVAGLAFLNQCSYQAVRSLFRDLRNALRAAAAAAAKAASKAAAKDNSAAQGGGGGGGAAGAAAAHPGSSHTHKQQQAFAGHEQQQLQQQYGRVQPFSNGLTHSYGSQLVQSPKAASADLLAAGSSSRDAGLTAAGHAAAAAAAAVASEALGSTCASIAAVLSIQKERLARTVDPDTGAITSRANAGQFLTACETLTTWSARSDALSALAASFCSSSSSGGGGGSGTSQGASRPRLAVGCAAAAAAAAGGGGGGPVGSSAAVRGALSNSRLVRLLSGWLEVAVQEQQTSFLVQALQVLAHINVSTGLLSGNSLQQQVVDLEGHRSPAVAAAAAAVSKVWAPFATAGPGSSSQMFGLGEVMQLGGAARAVTAGYKRRLSNVVKRKVEELQLTGDLAALRQQQQEQQGRQELDKGQPPAAAAAAAGRMIAAAAHVAAGRNAAAAGGAGAAAGGSGFKRPSKRLAAAAPAGPAAIGSCAASQKAEQQQQQQSQAEAARRLQLLHGLKKPRAAGQQQQPQHPQQQALTDADRMIVMSPHGRAPATFLAAAGGQAAEVTQAVMAFDRAVTRWQAARAAAAARERRQVAAAAATVQRWREAEPGTAAAAGGGGGRSDVCWPGPPLRVPAAALASYAAGEESELGASNRFLPVEVGELLEQPDESPALAAAAAAAAGPAAVPLDPVDPAEVALQCAKMWIAGVRLPAYITRPPTASDIARARQQAQQQQPTPQQSMPQQQQLQYMQQEQQQQQNIPQQQYLQQQEQQVWPPLTSQHMQPAMNLSGLQQLQEPNPAHLQQLQHMQQQPPAHHLSHQSAHEPPVLMMLPAGHVVQPQQQVQHLQQQQPAQHVPQLKFQTLPHLVPGAPPQRSYGYQQQAMATPQIPADWPAMAMPGSGSFPVQQQQQQVVLLQPPVQQHHQPMVYMLEQQHVNNSNPPALLHLQQPARHVEQPYLPQGH